MAKWGEGDPRWIVEERPDATNVNNWHWKEKNATPWSKDKLRQLLVGTDIEQGPCKISLTEMKTCDGEASANNRKAKLIFFFEWQLKLAWTGTVAGSDTSYSGEIDIPNLSDENTAMEVDVTPTCDTSGPHSDALLDILRDKGTGYIRDKLAVYIAALREEFSTDLVLPTRPADSKAATSAGGPQQQQRRPAASAEKRDQQKAASASAGEHIGGVETRRADYAHEFKAPPAQVFEAFWHEQLVSAWSKGPCEIDRRPGGKFAILRGMVLGQFHCIEPPHKVECSWRLRSYPGEHHAEMVMRFVDTGDSTKVEVSLDKVPQSQADETEAAVTQWIFANVSNTFGYGARLF